MAHAWTEVPGEPAAKDKSKNTNFHILTLLFFSHVQDEHYLS